MHNFDNFIDLRLNRRRQNDDSSLWPSFTDIMTVILMIFMLTMIVVIVKNANLAKELTVSQNEAQKLQAARQVPLMFSDLTDANGFGWWTDDTVAAGSTGDTEPIRGRYIHISLRRQPILSLAEVQVMSGGRNIARGKKTRQTSTLSWLIGPGF